MFPEAYHRLKKPPSSLHHRDRISRPSCRPRRSAFRSASRRVYDVPMNLCALALLSSQAGGRSTRAALAVVVLVAISAGCGSEPGDAPADVEPTADVSPTEIERLEPDVWIPPPCPAGEVHGVDGVCLAVGVQGCAPIFVDPDTGLCAPAVEDCAPGESLKLSEGCIPVGVLDCHPDFVDPASGASSDVK